jgi:16S rRNA (guanine966-N2)-methyltransferase
MRIITGTLKGRKLEVPAGEAIRPTSDRTKEGMFNVIETHKGLAGMRILDLFAGSGNLGFEAISRGAQEVLFIDSDRSSIEYIERTARKFGIEHQTSTRLLPVETYINLAARPYDIVFADPPYDYPDMDLLVGTVLNGGWLAEVGWFILEHDVRHNFREHAQCFFSRPYGRTIVTIFFDHPLKTEQKHSSVKKTAK